MAQQQPAIIIDNGTSTLKVGFGGEEAPRQIIPTVVAEERGYPKNAKDAPPLYCGKEALKKIQNTQNTGFATLKYPIQRGMIMDWDQMEELWDYSFELLKADPERHPVIMTANAFTPQKHRETMCEIMFETFKVPELYVAMPGYLSLYASGDNTGVVVESGEGITHIIPIADGVVMPDTTTRFPIAGQDVTQYLIRLLSERGLRFEPHQEMRIARHIKHNMCYTCYDFDDELLGAKQNPKKFEQTLDMNTGESIVIGNEAFRACEVMFEPSLLGCEVQGLHHAIVQCIEKIDVSLRKPLFNNICLGGGNLLFPGMADRIEKSIRDVLKQQKNLELKVNAAGHQYSAWQGASILTCLPEFQKQWITQEDYVSEGPSIVLSKCF